MLIPAPRITMSRNTARSPEYGTANASVRVAVPGLTFFFRTEASCPRKLKAPIGLFIGV